MIPRVRVEKHPWGYFLIGGEKAVAVIGGWADVIQALKEW